MHFTNCSLKIRYQNKLKFIHLNKIEESNYILIKPDEIKTIKIDLTLLNIDKQSIIKIVLKRKHRKISKKIM